LPGGFAGGADKRRGVQRRNNRDREYRSFFKKAAACQSVLGDRISMHIRLPTPNGQAPRIR